MLAALDPTCCSSDPRDLVWHGLQEPLHPAAREQGRIRKQLSCILVDLELCITRAAPKLGDFCCIMHSQTCAIVCCSALRSAMSLNSGSYDNHSHQVM